MLRRIAFVTFILVAGSLYLRTVRAQTSYDITMFHSDRGRTGWIANEVVLTPASVNSPAFGPLWNSPVLDSVVIGDTAYPPHLYASPLYVDRVTLSLGQYRGLAFSVILAASNNSWVYAINAFQEHGVSAGTILWRTQLGTPLATPLEAGALPLGILSTPVLDLSASPPRLYAASADATAGWQVFAVSLTSGDVLPGWPVPINNTVLASVNQNGPATFQLTRDVSQRGALNISPNHTLLYVPFGSLTWSAGSGWMVVIDTIGARVASAFSVSPTSTALPYGGIWGAGGPALDNQGNLYATTGNSPALTENAPRSWGNSLLVWNASSTLTLMGTYTPWNYCQSDTFDVDLGGGSPVVLPDLDPATTNTPRLVTFGGKQGNFYLVNRDSLPGGVAQRHPCSTNSTTDLSLLPPGPQPQFSTRGPLNVFGPYSEEFNQLENAKSRSTPAYFKAADGTNFLFVSGSSKATPSSEITVSPGLARLRIVTQPGVPAYLSVDQYENTQTLLMPGSPVVTSNGSSNAIVWLQVANVTRSDPLSSGGPHPILYAFDANTLQLLYKSSPDQLNVGGKYSVPAIARGVVFVGTDRIQAFGLSTPGGSWAVTASGGTPQSTPVNTTFGIPLQATVRDTTGAPINGVTVTFTAPGSGASAAFSGSTSATAVTNASGVATAPALTANATAGSYAVTATAPSVGTAASFSLTNTIAGGGLLSGTVDSSTVGANLTAEGGADWVHWGTTLNRKSGVLAQLSDYTVVGGGSGEAMAMILGR